MSDYDTAAAAKRCADAVLSSHQEARLSGIAEGLEAAARECGKISGVLQKGGNLIGATTLSTMRAKLRSIDPATIAAQREGGDG